jgi:excisionase family DNA binding protein
LLCWEVSVPAVPKRRLSLERTVTFDELNDIVTVDEAAAFLRVGRSLVYEAVRDRVIPSIRIGRRVLIPKTGLGALLGVGERLVQHHEGKH